MEQARWERLAPIAKRERQKQLFNGHGGESINPVGQQSSKTIVNIDWSNIVEQEDDIKRKANHRNMTSLTTIVQQSSNIINTEIQTFLKRIEKESLKTIINKDNKKTFVQQRIGSLNKDLNEQPICSARASVLRRAQLYTPATLAVKYVGCLGKEGSNVIDQVAAIIAGGTDGSSLTRKGVCKQRLFQVISVTTEVAISRRVHRYKTGTVGPQGYYGSGGRNRSNAANNLRAER